MDGSANAGTLRDGRDDEHLTVGHPKARRLSSDQRARDIGVENVDSG